MIIFIHLINFLYLARIGRPDAVWTVNMLARSVHHVERLIRPHQSRETLTDCCFWQAIVSHSSAESEINSFDADQRMEGKEALQLWECFRNIFGVPMLRESSRAQVASVVHHPIPLIICHSIWLTTFQATIERVSCPVQTAHN